jgi:hypothetical protein
MAKVKFKRFLSDSDLNNVSIEDGSFIVTKDGTSYVDYVDERVAFGTTPDTEMSDESIHTVQNRVIKSYVDDEVNGVQDNLNKIGKTLWEGSFSTGTLSVPGISAYSIIIIYVGGLAMIGNQSYGGAVFRAWRSTTHTSYAYRFNYNSTNESISTSTDNPGASDGTNQLTITKIIGVF